MRLLGKVGLVRLCRDCSRDLLERCGVAGEVAVVGGEVAVVGEGQVHHQDRCRILIFACVVPFVPLLLFFLLVSFFLRFRVWFELGDT